MMKNKKFLIAMLAALCTLSMGLAAGCGDKKDNESTPPASSDSIPDDIPDSFTVTFDSNGGSAVASATVEEGGKVTKPADPTKAEDEDYTYAFAGWYNGETAWNFETDVVTADVTLTAKWTATEKLETFTVTFDSNGGTTVASASVIEGNKVDKPADPTKAEDEDYTYAFAGWYNGETAWNFETDVVTANVTLTAKWTATSKFTYETIDVTDEAKVNLNFNNDGTASDTVIDLGLDEIMAKEEVTEYVVQKIGTVDVIDNVIVASAFGNVYGKQTIAVTVKAGTVVYTVNMPVLFVSKVIKTADDLQSFGAIATELGNKYNGVNNTYGGYFELGNDIDMAGASFGQFNEKDNDATSGIYGFDGVFDGCGYVISNAVSESQDGLLGVMTKNGVLKNVGFTNAKMGLPESGAYNFLGRTEFGAIENIYIQYAADGITGGSMRNFSLASGSYEEGDVTIKNVLIDASALTLTANTAYYLMANTVPVSNQMYLILPNDYASALGYVFGGWNGTPDKDHGFAGAEKLFASEVAMAEITTWETPWTVDQDNLSIQFGSVDAVKINKYTVTFDSNGGSAVEEISVTEGNAIAEPAAPTKEDDDTYKYTFAGWYNGDTQWDFSAVVTEDMTLTAKWTAIELASSEEITVETTTKVNLDLNNDGSVNSTKTIDLGLTAILAEKGVEEYVILTVDDTEIVDNQIPASIFGQEYGAKDIVVMAKAGTTTYTVNMPVLLVSKVITTVEHYNNWGNISKALNYGGYFELGADLSQEGGIAMVNWNTNSYWVSKAEDYKGFSGTFDGCGYVIDGLKMTANTSNNGGFIGTMTQTGTLQNIGFTNLDFSGVTGTSKFIGTTVYGNMKNVYMQISVLPSGAGLTTLGIVSKADVGLNANFTAENVFVDASAATETVETQRFQMLPDNNWNDAFYAIAPTGANVGYYTSWKNDAEGEEHYNHAFNTYAAFKANATAWATVSAWAEAEGSLWVVNAETGAVSYGVTAKNG